MLETDRSHVPRFAPDEIDDVVGVHGAEIDASITKSMDEKAAHGRSIATNRGRGQAAFTQQELLEVGGHVVSRQRGGWRRTACALLLQEAQQVMQASELIAPGLGSTVAARSTSSAVVADDVHV